MTPPPCAVYRLLKSDIKLRVYEPPRGLVQ